jgi:prevent-host-death family protein
MEEFMRQFGAFEAKTHFSELLGKVIKGEKFVITKHGASVAMIIPFTEGKQDFDPIENSIRALKNLRKGTKLGGKLSIKKMIEQGRR